jgi:glycosyltransferase involved in cell wall biosynthesis
MPTRDTPRIYLETGTFPLFKKSMPRNLIFVSHCDFRGNSAMHLFSIANVLTGLGHSCVVCVPERPETVLDHGKPGFQVIDYKQAARHGVTFADGRGPDLVHAWTPRELVRKATMSLVQRYNIPYFVHLEDNETVILLDKLVGWSLNDLEALPIQAVDRMVANQYTHPRRSFRFLQDAAGMTVLIDRLLEFKPEHVPGILFFPGCDAGFAKINERDEKVRTALGILPDELVVVYTGNVHHSNFAEVRNLLIAIALVNQRGFRVKLVKTGWNNYVLPELTDSEIAQHVIDRGFIARSEIPRLVAAADVLVQPGRSSEFNDYRFPAKLPEFLASGKPVILPRSNIGLLLKDGEEALLLKDGDSADIADALQRLAADQDLRARIGHNGRAFALRNLDWAKNVSVLPGFYDECFARKNQVVEVNAGAKTVVPKLVAFYPWQLHMSVEAMGSELASFFGIYGFGFYYSSLDKRSPARPLDIFLERGQPDFPFLVCWVNGNKMPRRDYGEDDVLISEKYNLDFSTSIIRELIPMMKDPRYIRVGGAPVLLVYRTMLFGDPRATAELWRGECKSAGIPSLHLVAVQAHEIGDPRQFGFDAKMEFLPPAGESLDDPHAALGSHFGEKYFGDYPKVLPDQPTVTPTLYFGVKPSIEGSSASGYQAWLRRATARAMASAETQEPLIFVDGRNAMEASAVLKPGVHRHYRFLEATRNGLAEGLADYLRPRGAGSEQGKLPSLSLPEEEDHIRMIIQAMRLGVPANLAEWLATEE